MSQRETSLKRSILRVFAGAATLLWVIFLGAPVAASTIYGYMGDDGTLYVSDRKLSNSYKVLYKSSVRRTAPAVPRSPQIPPAPSESASATLASPPRLKATGREMEQINSWVTYYGLCYRLDPKLIHAVITTESNYCVTAVSPKGAQGLMQIMPGTGRDLGLSRPFDPEDNIRAGVKYLREMVDRFQNTRLALAAYNAGPGAVEQYGGIPPYDETINYVEKVMGSYERLKTDPSM